MSVENDPAFWKWVWAILIGPIFAIWRRVEHVLKQHNDHRVNVAKNYADKDETQEMIDRTVNPIESKLDEFKVEANKKLDKLIDMHIKKNQ